IDRCFMVAALGIVIYAGIGFLSMFLGGEFLDYAHLATVLPVSQEMARYHAMLGVEVGVGFTVTAIICALYASLSSDGRMRDGL
ncbi:MAG: MnhB domain-containing protein, partial [Opitutae bacterium]